MAENYPEKTEIASVIEPQMPRAGDSVASYRLIKQLGTGGMGSVFLAEHLSIGRRVAMKFLLPELCQYPDIVGRFFDEARSVNRINHENIVEVFDFVREASGLSYLVMELLEGTDLYQTRKRDGPYPLDRVLVICEQIASALAAAHKVGIIHRDLKPENAFLIKRRGSHDFVKLLDFGLAKLSDELPMARMPTQAGIVMGTPGYMSPEQAHGAKVDGRSDVFSLGILMHWMLQDRVPESGPNSVAPNRSVRGDDVPDQLCDIITACIRLKPDDRPQSMSEVAAVLTDLRRQIRGTEVLQVIPRTGSQSLRRAEEEQATQVQGAMRARTTEEIPVAHLDEATIATKEMTAESLAGPVVIDIPAPPAPPQASPSRLMRPSTRLLFLVGFGSALLSLTAVGIGYLIFGPSSAPAAHPPDRLPDHAGLDPKPLTPPSTEVPHLPALPGQATGTAGGAPDAQPSEDDVAVPKAHSTKKKPHKKPATH